VGVSVTRAPGGPPGEDELKDLLADQGLSPITWGNAPGDRYGSHNHDYHKVLFCLSGSIVFHTDDGDVELSPGDRLDVEPRTDHAATVGPEGVRCIEAPRRA